MRSMTWPSSIFITGSPSWLGLAREHVLQVRFQRFGQHGGVVVVVDLGHAEVVATRHVGGPQLHGLASQSSLGTLAGQFSATTASTASPMISGMRSSMSLPSRMALRSL